MTAREAGHTLFGDLGGEASRGEEGLFLSLGRPGICIPSGLSPPQVRIRWYLPGTQIEDGIGVRASRLPLGGGKSCLYMAAQLVTSHPSVPPWIKEGMNCQVIRERTRSGKCNW